MGQARLRGTREERVAQSLVKAAERERWAPAARAARKDPRWNYMSKHERRGLLIEAAVKLGIIPDPREEKANG